MDWTFFAIAAPAVVFAGMSKGGMGSGGAFVATPILALLVDPAMALAIMLPLLMLMDVAALRAYWRQWDVPSAKVLIWASIPGTLLGAALYQYTDPNVFRVLIGVMALAFVLHQLAGRLGLLRLARAEFSVWRGTLAGVTTGFTSFVSHAGGPPVTMFLIPQGMNRTRFQATTVLVFWVVNISKVVPYAFLGFFTLETLGINLILAPLAFLGVWLGMVLHRRMSDALFFGITHVVLAIVGARLVWLGLS